MRGYYETGLDPNKSVKKALADDKKVKGRRDVEEVVGPLTKRVTKAEAAKMAKKLKVEPVPVTLKNTRIGNKVVCVDASGSVSRLKKGEVYTVTRTGLDAFDHQPRVFLAETGDLDWYTYRFVHAAGGK